MHARETILILSEEFSLYSSEVTLADDDDVRNITHSYFNSYYGFHKTQSTFYTIDSSHYFSPKIR